MDLFALGTPLIDMFAKADDALLKKIGVTKGATNYFSAVQLAAMEKKLGRQVFYRYAGDNARNVCEGFAALGGFCGFAGAVGADKAGAEFSANLSECGIADFLQEKKGSTGKIVALITPDKERTFCADLGVSSQCNEFDALAVENSRMLYLSSITLVVKAPVAKLALKYADAFKKAGKRIALSIENPPMVKENAKFLLSFAQKYADILFLNESEADALLGKGAERKLHFLKTKAPIYLKKGKHGSLLFYGGRMNRIAAMKAKVMDTTGAGDAYAAGALYGISRGYSVLSSAKLGCYLATKVVAKFGAGVPLAHTRIRLKHR